MPKFGFERLVRDKVVDRTLSTGNQVEYRVLDDDAEYKQALNKKLAEEVSELARAGEDEEIDEIADIQEICEELLKVQGKTWADVEAARTRKKEKDGAFDKRHYVEAVTLRDDDPWLDYYLADPEKFPKIT